MTGTPFAIASAMTTPNVSNSLAKTKQSEFSSNISTSSLFNCPERKTFSCKLYFIILFSISFRKGPSPPIYRATSSLYGLSLNAK